MCVICEMSEAGSLKTGKHAIINNLEFVRFCSKCKATNPKLPTRTVVERLDEYMYADESLFGYTLCGDDVYRTHESTTYVSWVDYFCPMCCKTTPKSSSWTMPYDLQGIDDDTDDDTQDVVYDAMHDKEPDEGFDEQFDEQLDRYDEMAFAYLDRLDR